MINLTPEKVQPYKAQVYKLDSEGVLCGSSCRKPFNFLGTKSYATVKQFVPCAVPVRAMKDVPRLPQVTEGSREHRFCMLENSKRG